MAAYNPGTATEPVKVGPGRYCIDSFRGETRTYEVDTAKGTCTCPHWVSRLSQQEHAVCKHLQACHTLEASQPQPTKLEKAAETAKMLDDVDLRLYAEKYQGQAAGAACLLEMAHRAIAALAAPAQPKPIPAGVLALLQGATDAERERALAIYRS